MKRIVLIFLMITVLLIPIIGISCDSNSTDSSGNGNNDINKDTVTSEISGITVSNITSTTATISWTTDEPATGNIEYGPDTDYGHSYPSPADTTANSTEHSWTIEDLTPDTTYNFIVKSTDNEGSEFISGKQTFTTGSPSEDITAPVISNITEVYVMSSGATITWTTDEPATSQVEYGETDSYGSTTAEDADLVTTHSVTLSSLSADTEYHFRVKSKGESDSENISGDHNFTTMPVNPSVPISLFFYGEHSDIVDEAIINARPEFLVGNSMAGPRKGNADISKFTAAGIKYFEYLAGGYEEKYPKGLPVDLQSNLDFIEAIADAGAYGIFVDEVSDGIWTPIDYGYLQQISAKAHSQGLKIVFNTGMNDWADGLMDYCDYIGSTEQWANAPLTASQTKWSSRLWLLRRQDVEDAATAAKLTIGAWEKGALSAYATSSLVKLPLWLPEYISLISAQTPDTANISSSRYTTGKHPRRLGQ